MGQPALQQTKIGEENKYDISDYTDAFDVEQQLTWIGGAGGGGCLGGMCFSISKILSGLWSTLWP